MPHVQGTYVHVFCLGLHLLEQQNVGETSGLTVWQYAGYGTQKKRMQLLKNKQNADRDGNETIDPTLVYVHAYTMFAPRFW